MPKKLHLAACRFLLALTVLGVTCPVFGAGTKTLHGHVPEAIGHLKALGNLPATNELHLAIGLPLHHVSELKSFMAQLYDPASPNFHQFLTPEEFTANFGPTEVDYQAVKAFAHKNGLAVTKTYGNRLVLDVSGPAAAVEKAFQVTLHTYRHPTEARDFFAPASEPVVDAQLPVVDIQGMSDYGRPHPRLHQLDAVTAMKAAPRNGSSPDGNANYFGNDFRGAYVPGTPWTGAGQSVGLLEFDGFYANDIAAYAQAAGNGRTNIVIQTVLLDSYNGVPTTGKNSGNGEVSLDIELAMALAPGLAKIVVYEAGPRGLQNDILTSMVSNGSTVKNLSCSWGWPGGPSTTTDGIFTNMAAVGQSFFNASGDSCAFTTGATSVNGVDSTALQNAPSSSPYITQVGGTTLTTDTNAAYASETVWNWNVEFPGQGYDGVGSSGGISSDYSIPNWQTNVSNLVGRSGSASLRNIPDVAMTADNVYVISGGKAAGSDGNGGTSCAAPLWAAFTALVNQQAAASGNAKGIGFINPAIYAIAAGAGYANCFHDVTTGNNTWSSSPGLFYATNGYDLCTGLGTPNGTNLINALATPGDTLVISPITGLALGGPLGGPFNPGSGTFQLTNSSAAPLNWSLVVTSAWAGAAFTNGTLDAHTATNLAVSLTAAAGGLAPGNYSTSLRFTNQVSHVMQIIPVTLAVVQPLSVSPVKGFIAAGPVGGAFTSGTQVFVVTNLSVNSVNWSLINTSAWLTASVANGALAAYGQTNVNISLSAAANTLAAGVYAANVVFSNVSGVFEAVAFTLLVGQPVIQNGGFETGDFTGWTQSGNTADTTVSTTSTYVHGGTHGVKAGPSGAPGYLSQNLTTAAGQNYLLSLWVRNAAGSTPNLFQVQWNGATIFNQANFAVTAWTNLQFLVTANSSVSVLQLGFQDDPSYLGLDDVNVTPIANPGFKFTVKAANSFKLVFDATAGLKYQAQYKTNLTQAAWFNLGSVITATTNALSITDTNLASSGQRYYRLQVTP